MNTYPRTTPPQPQLRAAEFAATLNGGGNPQAILRVLRRFVKTVKWERKWALTMHNDENDSESESSSSASDGESVENRGSNNDNNDDEVWEPPRKKYKKSEQWKEDTAAYHVPFVGTAVARGDLAPVNKGEWPTGLLRAYLEKSPFAIELLHDDLRANMNSPIHKPLLKKRRRKFSEAISRAHLLAVAELLTVAFPKVKQRGETHRSVSTDGNENVDSTMTRFLPSFVKGTLPWVAQLLNEETDKGRGKTGVRGGCGSLVAPALHVFRNAVQISTYLARVVSRHLDESLADGVLRICLRSPPPRNEESKTHRSSSLDESTQFEGNPVRVESLRLARFLLLAGDSAVTTYICTSGDKERKIKPGIVYVALREGLATPSKSSDHLKDLDSTDGKYFSSVSDLLRTLRLVVFEQSPNAQNNRLYSALLSKDPLRHILRLASFAPPLTSEIGFRAVMDGSDTYDPGLPVHAMTGVEARRFLFLSLSGGKVSPLSQRQSSDEIGWCLTRMLESKNSSVELRRFVIFCVRESPYLLSNLFQLLNSPDAMKSIDFVTRVGFVIEMLREVPNPFEVSRHIPESVQNMNEEECLAALLPSRYKGQFLARSLHSGNVLVQLECLKLLFVVVKRFECSVFQNMDEGFRDRLSTLLAQSLPDTHVLLSLYSKLDKSTKSGAIIASFIFRIFKLYLTNFHGNTLNQESFDPWKFLPKTASEFHSFLPAAQIGCLRCIQLFVRRSQHNSLSLLLSSETLFEVLFSAKSKEVYDMACNVLVEILACILQPVGSNDVDLVWCIQYEASTWISCLTRSLLHSFMRLLERISREKLWTHVSFIGRAWKKYNVRKKMSFSVLVATALADREAPSPFCHFVGQVVSRCLLRQLDPTTLASVLIYAAEEEGCTGSSPALMPLTEYAKLLVNRFSNGRLKTQDWIRPVLRSYFMEGMVHSRLFDNLTGRAERMMTSCEIVVPISGESHQSEIALIRFVNQVFIVLQKNRISEFYMKGVSSLASSLILKSSESSSVVHNHMQSTVSEICSILNHHSKPLSNQLGIMAYMNPFSDFSQSHIIIVPEIVRNDQNPFDNISASSKTRERLLYQCLVGRKIPMCERAKAMLDLLTEGEGALSDIEIQIASCFFQLQGEKLNSDEFDVWIWKKVIDSWLRVSQRITPRGDAAAGKVSGMLSWMMCQAISEHSIGGSVVLSLLHNYPKKQIVNACFRALSPAVDSEAALLFNLVKREKNHYASLVVTRLSEMDDIVTTLWYDGIFDIMLIRIMDEANEKSFPCLKILIPLVFIRTVNALRDRKWWELRNVASLLELTGSALNSTSFEQDVHGVIEAVDDLLIKLCDCHDEHVMMSPAMEGICRLASLIRKLELEGSRIKQHQFAMLFNLLPRILKIGRTTRRPRGLSRTTTLKLLLELAKDIQDFDIEILKLIPTSVVGKTIRACLKYGIVDTSADEEWASLSLQFTEHVLKLSIKPHSPFASIVPPLSEVFEKITFHSKFPSLFIQIDQENSSNLVQTRKGVVRLLILCVSMAPEEPRISSSTWQQLCFAFQSRQGGLDHLINKLVNICPYESRPLIYNFQFTENVEDCLEFKSRSFDSFVQTLNAARVRASVAHFPIHAKCNLSDEAAEEFGVDDADMEESENIYSPLQFLPLLLATLEECVGGDLAVNSPAPDLASSTYFSGLSIAQIHLLCEKGAVGFCFMSLASTCENARMYAVAALGVFVQAVGSDKAKEVASWKVRPQLQMILDAVQRGLALHKTQWDRNEPIVPRLLPIVALFLARASFVLCRPDDPLYEAVNRYFLKSESNHGAFEDFNRLPAFVSMFCSEALDPRVARSERMWAIRNIRDGLLDAPSFRLLASCHAPDLILTSFENVRLSSTSSVEAKSAEFCALLQSLNQMMKNGGYAAHMHLLRRCGLLSWMSSICNRKQYDFFPSPKTCTDFCDLVIATTEVLSESSQLRSELSLIEGASLVNPLLSLCISEPVENAQHQLQSVLGRVLNALKSISNLLLKLDTERMTCHGIQHIGAQLDCSLKVLNLVSDASTRQEMLLTLCDLPISLTGTDLPWMYVVEFLVLSLHCFKSYMEEENHFEKKSASFALRILRRMALVLQSSSKSGREEQLTGSRTLMEQTFCMRCHLDMSYSETQSLWLKCLGLLLKIRCSASNVPENLEDNLSIFISNEVLDAKEKSEDSCT